MGSLGIRSKSKLEKSEQEFFLNCANSVTHSGNKSLQSDVNNESVTNLDKHEQDHKRDLLQSLTTDNVI